MSEMDNILQGYENLMLLANEHGESIDWATVKREATKTATMIDKAVKDLMSYKKALMAFIDDIDSKY